MRPGDIVTVAGGVHTSKPRPARGTMGTTKQAACHRFARQIDQDLP
jgi:hypothetical protein